MKDEEKNTLINSLQTISSEISKIYEIMISSQRSEEYYLITKSKNVNDALQSLWKVESNKELESLISLLKDRK